MLRDEWLTGTDGRTIHSHHAVASSDMGCVRNAVRMYRDIIRPDFCSRVISAAAESEQKTSTEN